MNSQQCWKAKFESNLFSRVQSHEITVCTKYQFMRGPLKALNDSKLIINESILSNFPDHLGSIWYHSKPSDDPYFTKQYITAQVLFLPLGIKVQLQCAKKRCMLVYYFVVKSHLHELIWTYTFINFEQISHLHTYLFYTIRLIITKKKKCIVNEKM